MNFTTFVGYCREKIWITQGRKHEVCDERDGLALRGRRVHTDPPVHVPPDKRMMDKVWPSSLPEQHEERMKGLSWTRGVWKCMDTHKHTHTLSRGSQCVPVHLLTDTAAQQTRGGLWNLHWTESRHIRPWCRLELLLRFTVAVKLLSPSPPLIASLP